ncbi:MAG: hypothetical protein OXF77_00885 [Thaumarchaeota archaeon]|nr:hypothetical protein [Nitrososphaerota archaeon]
MNNSEVTINIDKIETGYLVKETFSNKKVREKVFKSEVEALFMFQLLISNYIGQQVDLSQE